MRVARPAILDSLRADHVVIEASAGTGKTYTLEHLVVDLVLQGMALPEILIVTYTNKATLELRERVRGLLHKLLTERPTPAAAEVPAWDFDEAARERVRAALSALDQATISTIHGFCQRVLKESALENRALFTREQVDGDALFTRAYEDCLRTDFTAKPELAALLESALEEGLSVEALGRELHQAHKERARVFPDLAGLPAHLRAFPRELGPRWPEVRAAFQSAGLRTVTLNALERRWPGLADLARWSEIPLGFLNAWKTLKLERLAEACAAGTYTGITETLANWVNAFIAFGASPSPLRIATLLPPVRARLAALKADEGLFDFDDMVLDVRAALEGPGGEGLVARLRATYKAALIDEFQDTDAAQWEIFRRIFHVEGHRLVLIGDPKQAIYGFRGGDLPTYRQAVETVAPGGTVARLAENFRSTAEVIDGYNHLLEGLLDGKNAYPVPVNCGKKSLVCVDAQGQPLTPITVLPLHADSAGPDLQGRMARALAAELEALLASGPRLEGERSQALTWKDVFILVGKTSEGILMAEALAARSIPYAFYKQKGLFKTGEAEAWLAVLRAIAEPWDATRVAQALLTPFFGFTIPGLEGLPELGEAHPIRERLRAWGTLAQARRFPALLDAVVRESGVLPRLLLQHEGERALTNLQHLAELLAQASLQNHGDLEDLIHRLERWREGTENPLGEDEDLQRLEGRADAVQLMTLHTSKGLEAPVVAIFAPGQARNTPFHRFEFEGARALWIGTPPAADHPHLREIGESIERTAQEEAQRLIYVALTRAKAKLLLPCVVTHEGDAPARKGLSPVYACLNARLFRLLHDEGELHPAFEVRTEAEIHRPASPAPGARGGSDWVSPVAPHPSPLDEAAVRKGARARATFSFTGLQKQLERDHRASEREDPEPDELPPVRPAEALPSGKEMGVLLHGLLEVVDLADLRGRTFEAWWKTCDAFKSLAEARLRLCGLEPRWAASVARLVHLSMTTPFPWIGAGARAVADAPRLLRELDFLTASPGTPDFLEGSLDALLEFEGRAFILDWKSNTLPAYDDATLAAHVKHHYELQVRIYTLAALRFLGVDTEADYEARFGGVAYVYLRGLPEAGFWHARPAWAEVQAWRGAVARITTEAALG